MKYKPRQSNFEVFSDEVASRVLEAKATIEDVKDAIAKEIDEYVDAIMKEHLDSAKMYLLTTAPEPMVTLSLGEDHKRDGTTDLFYKDYPLREILGDFDSDEFEESADAVSMAEVFESLAKQCREQSEKLTTGALA